MDLHLIYFNELSNKPQARIGRFQRGLPEDFVQVYELSLLHFADEFSNIELHRTHQALPAPTGEDVVVLYAEVSATEKALNYADSLGATNVVTLLCGPAVAFLPEADRQQVQTIISGSPQVGWRALLRRHLGGERLPRRYAPVGTGSPFVVDRYPAAALRVFRNYYGSFFNVALSGSDLPPTAERGSAPLRSVEDVTSLLKASPDDTPLYFTGTSSFIEANGLARFLELVATAGKPWVAEVSASSCTDTEWVRSFVRSGCKLLLLDLHSFNTAELNRHFGGSVTRPMVAKCLEVANTLGLRVFVKAQFGFADESPDVFEEAFTWMKQLGFERWLPQLHSPLPAGTDLADLTSGKELPTSLLSAYDGYHMVHAPVVTTAAAWESAFYDFHRRVHRYAFRKVIIEQNV